MKEAQTPQQTVMTSVMKTRLLASGKPVVAVSPDAAAEVGKSWKEVENEGCGRSKKMGGNPRAFLRSETCAADRAPRVACSGVGEGRTARGQRGVQGGVVKETAP